MVSVSAPSESQLSMVLLIGSPEVVPEATTPVTVTVWVSLRSTSVKVTAPVAVSAGRPVGFGCGGSTVR